MKEERFHRFSIKLAERPFTGAALVFDLEGFTEFCQIPQVEQFLPRLLNRTFEHIAENFPQPKGRRKRGNDLSLHGVAPVHCKFLGDGGLVIWRLPTNTQRSQAFLKKLLHVLHLARDGYPTVRQALQEEVGIDELPTQLRFGLAVGTILPLRVEKTKRLQFVGFPINLASRLQCYWRPLGIIASARYHRPLHKLRVDGFTHVLALKLKGFDRERVVVEETAYAKLKGRDSQALFAAVT
jgi:class 3 adenylate cyclase